MLQRKEALKLESQPIHRPLIYDSERLYNQIEERQRKSIITNLQHYSLEYQHAQLDSHKLSK